MQEPRKQDGDCQQTCRKWDNRYKNMGKFTGRTCCETGIPSTQPCGKNSRGISLHDGEKRYNKNFASEAITGRHQQHMRED